MLERLRIKGWRSIREMDLELRPLNVLIGANGAGKSNLIAFFKLLNEMMGQRLQRYFGTTGRAASNLYFGPKATSQIEASLAFATEKGHNRYEIELVPAAGDGLIFGKELAQFLPKGEDRRQQVLDLGAGHAESLLGKSANDGHPLAKVTRHLLNTCRVYHFHDTSESAPMRHFGYLGDTKFLLPNAGNLAAMLCAYQQSARIAYDRILATAQQILPELAEFVLEPDRANPREIALNWRRRNSDHLFGPHQLSDGSLRAIALITLLLQPEKELPQLIILDEPELGLHPHALEVVAGLIQSIAPTCQILVATQSAAFLSFFEAKDVVVVETQADSSIYRRLDLDALESWLADYSLEELWRRNVLGGGPLS